MSHPVLNLCIYELIPSLQQFCESNTTIHFIMRKQLFLHRLNKQLKHFTTGQLVCLEFKPKKFCLCAFNPFEKLSNSLRAVQSAKGDIHRWRQHILVISQEGYCVSEKQAKPLQENETMFFTLMREYELYTLINQKKNSVLLIICISKKDIFSHHYCILDFVNKIFVRTFFFSYYLSICILPLISLGPPGQMYLPFGFIQKNFADLFSTSLNFGIVYYTMIGNRYRNIQRKECKQK